MLYAARTDLQIGTIGVIIPLIIGAVLGLFAGYYAGWPDAILGRVVDVVTAFPFLVLVLAIVAMLGPGLTNFYIAISLVSWVAYARIVRGEALSARGRGYILAAQSLGYGDIRIMFRHLLPNVIVPALVFGMSDFVLDILAGASLGFFGLGVQPPTPEWGVMIAEGRNFILTAPWVVIFPGLATIVDQLLREPGRRQRVGHRAPGPCALGRPWRSTASRSVRRGPRSVVRGVSFTIALRRGAGPRRGKRIGQEPHLPRHPAAVAEGRARRRPDRVRVPGALELGGPRSGAPRVAIAMVFRIR